MSGVSVKSHMLLVSLTCSKSMHCFFLKAEVTHPSLIYIHHLFIKVTRKLKPVTADFGREMGYTLGGKVIYYRANTETNQLTN